MSPDPSIVLPGPAASHWPLVTTHQSVVLELPDREPRTGDTEAVVTEWIDVNRAMWDERADVHAASPDYAFEQYVADPTFLSHVVRFDVPRLGDLTGLRGVHLQCHIGTDTLSLHRLGAQMTGLDFSGAGSCAGPRPRGPRPAPTSRTSSPSCTAPPRRCPSTRTTSSSPGSARCAGCPTSGGGPTWWPGCSNRAAGSSCARVTRCSGRWPTHARTACSRSSIRTSSGQSPRPGTSPGPTSRPTTSS